MIECVILDTDLSIYTFGSSTRPREFLSVGEDTIWAEINVVTSSATTVGSDLYMLRPNTGGTERREGIVMTKGTANCTTNPYTTRVHEHRLSGIRWREVGRIVYTFHDIGPKVVSLL